MKIGSGIIWSSIERFGYSGIVFILTIILARILKPTDFGLIGTLSLFIGISQILIDSGLGGALIRKKDIKETDFNTVFTINLSISVILYILLFFLAPYISDFYQNPELSLVLRVLSLSLLFNAISLIGKVRLLRNLEYKKIALISIISVISSGLLSIVAAMYDLGYWALVIQTTCYYFFLSILLYFFTPIQLKFGYSKASFKSLFGFGGSLLISSLMQVLVYEGLTSVISKKYSLSITGYYYQAKKLIDFPVSICRSIADAAIFPILSRIDEKDELVDQAFYFLSIIIILTFPLFTIIFFCSETIISVILGNQWMESAVYLRILCIGAFFLVVEGVNRNFIKSIGKSSVILRAEIYKKLLDILLIAVTFTYGLNMLLYALVLSNFIASLINMVFFSLLLKTSFFNQIFYMIKFLFVNLCCGFLSFYIISNYTSLQNILQSFYFLVLFIGQYFFVIKFVFPTDYKNILTLIQR